MSHDNEQSNEELNLSPSSRTSRYLQFDLGEEVYAIHLLSVKEVIPIPETTPLPNCPDYYVGIMNLRGQIISIVDLRKKLKISTQGKAKKLEAQQGAAVKGSNDEAVIIIEIGGVGIGVVVDAINRVLNISVDMISEVPEVSSQVNAKYIEGVYKGDSDLTILLDLASVLNIPEIRKMHAKSA